MSVETTHQTISLDQIDRNSYRPGSSPLDSAAEVVTLAPGAAVHPAGAPVISLDGVWQMAEGGERERRVKEGWPDEEIILADVPGSVHAALVKAGIIPDPTFAKYDAIAREQSFKNWYIQFTFPRPCGTVGERLVFDGVCSEAAFYLNGELLGEHNGMFGGPEFDIAGKLRDENTLLVNIRPAPYKEGLTGFFVGLNNGWRGTVVFNNVYGWHYSNIPSLGIWRPARIESAPAVRINHPFVVTRDLEQGEVELLVNLTGAGEGWQCTLAGTVAPENFDGEPYHFTHTVASTTAEHNVHLRMAIPDPRLWWPLDLGEPNLYRLTLSLLPAGDGIPATASTTFGIRTIEMAPLPGGPFPDKYDWTFIINGRRTFVKGNGWCTMDPLMDFSRERYDRFLSIAASQHVQMVRAWGSGMPETDDFYDLCDRKGIMVFQEWPTAWNSHLEQPYPALEETVRLNTLRIRNHPSLALLSGGNESWDPFGPAIDMMGRYATELDGTRAFHRGEPWGGSQHDYNCWWGRQHLDYNVKMEADFYGEFGIASLPCYESVQRYLPALERDAWPPLEYGAFAHHTPTFNKGPLNAADMGRLRQYAGYFTEGATMARFIEGSQLAQAVALRHPLERARTRWPYCTGALYYKMNDNFPAASWSTADWYGVPKIAHYFCQDAFSPLHACVLFDKLDYTGEDAAWPVYLLDDADTLADAPWQVVVRAFDGALQLIKREEYPGQGGIAQVKSLGEFTLTAAQTRTTPLFIVVDVLRNGKQADRTFYWLNFEAVKDSLFNLPRTELVMCTNGEELVVKNTGALPAVAVHFPCPAYSDIFLPEDAYFWLDVDEKKALAAEAIVDVGVTAWNVDGCAACHECYYGE